MIVIFCYYIIIQLPSAFPPPCHELRLQTVYVCSHIHIYAKSFILLDVVCLLSCLECCMLVLCSDLARGIVVTNAKIMIANGQMDPISVEAYINRLEKSYPGITQQVMPDGIESYKQNPEVFKGEDH